ncbi:MAG TPA: PaaI family thioesterase [Thermohalobaculum sp.]|nr:PaaI family thioesterase [Thermohalobaculum sp.]
MSGLPLHAEREAERDRLLQALLETVPYHRLLGVRFDRLGDELTARLPYEEKLIGNPRIPALHGGVTASFLEIAGQMQLAWDFVSQRVEGGGAVPAGLFPAMPKTIDITIDYLRRGRPRETFARTRVQKAGRRVAHLHVEAWQDEHARPIAMLRGNFLMPEA